MSVALVFAALILSGCNQVDDLTNIDGATYNAEYAVPIVNTSFSMEDVLEDFEENSVLSVLPDGLLRLQYSGDVITETADDVLEEINQTLSSAGIIPVTEEEQALPFSGPEGLDVDKMDLKAGNLLYNISNCDTVPITATITFPTVLKNGVPLSITKSLPAHTGSGDCPVVNNLVGQPISLKDYTINTVNDSLFVNYSAVDADGNSYDAPATGTYILIANLEFSYIEGYLGQIEHSSDRDTIEIDFFDNWIQGDIYFEDPTINFHFENSFGLPTRSVVEVFEIITVDGDHLPLESEHITNGVDFPHPTIDEVGETKTKDFVFNKDNSNIREVLSAGPVAIDYDLDANTNPEGNPDIKGFVTDSSVYKVRVDVDLPLYGWAINFSVRDTVDLDFSSFDNAEYAEFKLVTENEMPVSIGLQGYFQDESGQILDSLFTQEHRAVEGASVDAAGESIAAAEVTTFIDYPEERFVKIKKAKLLELVVSFHTTTEGDQSVKIKADQNVNVKMGAILGVKGEE